MFWKKIVHLEVYDQKERGGGLRRPLAQMGPFRRTHIIMGGSIIKKLWVHSSGTAHASCAREPSCRRARRDDARLEPGRRRVYDYYL